MFIYLDMENTIAIIKGGVDRFKWLEVNNELLLGSPIRFKHVSAKKHQTVCGGLVIKLESFLEDLSHLWKNKGSTFFG